MLAWPAPVGFSTEEHDGSLFVRFDRPLEGDFWAIRKLRRFTRLPAIGDDGRSLIFPLRRDVAAVASAAGDKVVVEFGPARPQSGAAEPPTAAPTVAPPPATEPAMPSPSTAVAEPAAGSTATTPTAAEHPATAAKKDAALRFQWDHPVAAAVFRRGETLWCVFDSPSQQDTSALAGRAGPPVRRIEQAAARSGDGAAHRRRSGDRTAVGARRAGLDSPLLPGRAGHGGADHADPGLLVRSRPPPGAPGSGTGVAAGRHRSGDRRYVGRGPGRSAREPRRRDVYLPAIPPAGVGARDRRAAADRYAAGALATRRSGHHQQ